MRAGDLLDKGKGEDPVILEIEEGQPKNAQDSENNPGPVRVCDSSVHLGVRPQLQGHVQRRTRPSRKAHTSKIIILL